MRLNSKLNSNHKRVLSSTAKIVDEELQEIEQMLFDKQDDSKMNIVEKSFSPGESKDLSKQIKLLQKMNLAMFDNFGLTSKTLSEKQIIYAKVSYLWTILSDSRSKKLRSYGQLDAEAGREIDGYIDKMLTEIEKMLSI